MFTSLISSKLAALGVAGALIFGVLGGGVAYAQQSSGSADPTPVAIQQAAKGKPGIFKNLMADIISKSGLSKNVFKDGFKNGKSINDILTAHSKEPKTVEAAVLADVDTRIQDALKAGKIIDKQVDALTKRAEPTLDKLFAAEPKHKPGDGAAKVREFGKQELDAVAKIAGTDTKTLLQDLKNDETIAQVAGDKTPTVISTLTADATAALDKALARNKITKAQHDKMVANVPVRVDNFVNKPHNGHPKGAAPANGQN
jgi:hypothetical protein